MLGTCASNFGSKRGIEDNYKNLAMQVVLKVNNILRCFCKDNILIITLIPMVNEILLQNILFCFIAWTKVLISIEFRISLGFYYTNCHRSYKIVALFVYIIKNES